MDLYKEILIKALESRKAEVFFPGLQIDPAQIVEGRCYQALNRIREILRDESLDDRECFLRIEEIVALFEEIGSGCGGRHDFG
ncbi:MAG: hypothetical protein HFJ85_06630 [Oscillospiraceae bacterium]|nr:hypothetical protein [Oscillospiraceae bacterium]